MHRLVLIFLGGGCGTVLRYLVQGWVQKLAGPVFPLGTMVVNLSGCLVIGLLGSLLLGPRPIAEDYRFAILTGLLGGYTTFSTFGWETLKLTEEGEYLYAGLNVVLSVALGLTGVWLGRQLIHTIYGP
jgi:CrcB protein